MLRSVGVVRVRAEHSRVDISETLEPWSLEAIMSWLRQAAQLYLICKYVISFFVHRNGLWEIEMRTWRNGGRASSPNYLMVMACK